MYNPGIIRKLDNLGRIVIPKEIRKRHEIDDGDFVTICDGASHIIIKKYRSGCIFCGSEEDITEYRKLYVCRSCRMSLNKGL